MKLTQSKSFKTAEYKVKGNSYKEMSKWDICVLIRYEITCILVRHFSVAEIPTTHCRVYN